MGDPKVVAIIQARMGSTRLPGKVLQPLVGKPVLWHVLHRLRACKTVDQIVVATSTDPGDEALVDYCVSEDMMVVRGPEDNVLMRYAMAAAKSEADIILRVTADCPLIDPTTIDKLITLLIETQAGYATSDPEVANINEGFSPFSRSALEKLVAEASDDAVAVEHITAYFKAHPDFVPVSFLPVPPEHQFSGARISIDTPADLRFIEEIYRRLNVPPGEVELTDVVALLREYPELTDINAHVHQKLAHEATRTIAIRCDGDSEVGLGHVVRCIALATELRDIQGCGVKFLMIRGPEGQAMIEETGFPVMRMKADENETQWLRDFVGSNPIDALVLDIRTDLSLEAVRRLRDQGVAITIIDDGAERRLASDLAFYPPVPQVDKLDWSDYAGSLYHDWQYVILRKEFGTRPERSTPLQPLRLLVTMGGSDPHRLTLFAVRSLAKVGAEVHVDILVGRGYQDHAELSALLQNFPHSQTVLQDVDNVPQLMVDSDLAVASFGVTAYELAAMRIPAIYLSITPDHAESAGEFERLGFAWHLGLYTDVAEAQLTGAIQLALADAAQRREMNRLTSQHVIGQGAASIAELMLDHLDKASVAA